MVQLGLGLFRTTWRGPHENAIWTGLVWVQELGEADKDRSQLRLNSFVSKSLSLLRNEEFKPGSEFDTEPQLL